MFVWWYKLGWILVFKVFVGVILVEISLCVRDVLGFDGKDGLDKGVV